MAEQFDVIIAGAGPVGLGLAIELGQHGVRCLLVERSTDEHRIPKGQSLTNRTLEHFRAWQCVDALRRARTLPLDFPIGGITAYRSLVGDYWLYVGGGGPGRGKSVQGLFSEEPERLPQYHTEAVLYERLAVLPSVTLRRGWTLEALVQSADGVEATIASDDRTETVSAQYLVGSDGSRSTVRSLTGITSTSEQLGSRMVLAVFRSSEFEDIISRFPPSAILRVLSPALKGHWQFFGRIDATDSWFFHAPVADGEVSTDDIKRLIFGAVGRPFAMDVEHAGFWDLRISIADEYRSGRVFLAGDACHSHPPYGGFGLNSGLEDSRNLGWKLRAALAGWGGEALLASYTEERRPIFERTAEIIAAFIDGDRQFMERFDPAVDREAFEAAWPVEMRRILGAAYLPHYEGSSIVVGREEKVPGVDGQSDGLARAGHHLAPDEVGGREVADLVGGGFLLLAYDAPADRFRAAAEETGIPVVIAEDSSADNRYGKRLILVRPDGFVAWTGDEEPGDAAEILRRVAGVQPAPLPVA